MVKAYVSLHTQLPTEKLEGEVCYKGYARLFIDMSDTFGNEAENLFFPEIQEDMSEDITHVCFTNEEGLLLMTVSMLPYLKMTKGLCPHVVVTNMKSDGLPVELNPIARLIYHLYKTGEIKSEDLHPLLYEAVNMCLTQYGIPVIPVSRTGAYKMDVKMADMGSLAELFEPKKANDNLH